jgi:hypothetical protein
MTHQLMLNFFSTAVIGYSELRVAYLGALIREESIDQSVPSLSH